VTRHALFAYAFNAASTTRPIPDDIALALQQADTASVPVAALNDPATIRAVLTACARRLDGRPAAATTTRRKRAVLANALRYAVELTSLTCADIRIQAGPHVHCTGKGRKERDTPLLRGTVRILKAWLAERGGQPGDPLFPGPSGQRLSRDAVERRVRLYHERASAGCPSMAAKHVTVHTLRHSAAMRLLLAGVDITVIALWLGHESLTSTQAYLHADMHQKQEAIGKTAPPGSRQKRYQPPDPLLEFLENL
jgi:integrase/recombinase XerD